MPTNLLGKNPELPYELQTEAAQLAMAQAIAMELIKQGLTPVESESVGGLLLPSAGRQVQAQSQLSQGKKMLGDVGTRQGVLAALYNKMVSEGMGQYSDLLTGGQPVPPPVDQVGPPSQYTRPDQMAAARYAGTSGLPPLMKLAEDRYKGYPTGKEMLESMDKYAPGPGRTRFMETLNPEYLAPMPKYHAQGDIGVTEQGGFPVQAAGIKHYEPPRTNPALGVPSQLVSETGKEELLTPNLPQTTRETARIGGELKQIEAGYENAKGIVSGLKTIWQLKEDLATMPASKFGALADLQQGVDKLLETFGRAPLPATAKYDTIQAQLRQLILTDIRKLAPVTQEDIAFMQSTVGAPNFTKDGLIAILNRLELRNREAFREHERKVRSWASQYNDPERAAQQWIPQFEFQLSPSPRSSKSNRYSGATDEEIRAEVNKQRLQKGGSGGW